MKTCIYAHKTLDGFIFYIGQGQLKRAYDLERSKRSGRGTCRGAAYSAFVESLSFKYEVEILESNLSKIQADILELEYYTRYKDQLVNYAKPSKEKVINVSCIFENLYYDETSPSCLRWKTDRRNGRGIGENKKIFIHKGDVAGCIQEGYYVVNLKGSLYKAHRLVAILHNLDILGLVIDHIDGNGLNNKISNLRVTTQAVNSRNLKASGDKFGVSKSKSGTGFYSWVARWKFNGKSYSKWFSIIKYGEEGAYLKACEYRDLKISELNKLGAGYTELHTK